MKTVTVHILRNTMASGVAYSEGDKPELSERDADILVRLRKAEYLKAKKTAVPDTADTPPEGMPAADPAATIKTATNKRGGGKKK